MSSLRPPTHIETERLQLRPVVATDAEAIHGYASSPAVTRFMNWPTHTTLEPGKLAQQSARWWSQDIAYPWAVIAKTGGAFLGVIELRLSPPRSDFGYVFCERFWGQGFATEAATAVVDWAIAQPAIYRIWATCHPDNIGSAHVLQKAGLTFEARLENWEARPQLGEIAGPSLMFAKIRPGEVR